MVGDAAYHGPSVRDLPAAVTWTCRLPKNAVLHGLAPPRRPGTRGRHRLMGHRLGIPADLTAVAGQVPATVRVYGHDQATMLTDVTCLWYGCLGTRTVRVILASHDASVLALVTTDLTTPAAQITERYAARWSIEQAFADARNVLGGGEARNRVPRAVERTVPFTLLIHSLIVLWYARHGHDHADTAARRTAQPWYQSKTESAFEDMLAKLRRTMITARISRTRSTPPTPQETQEVLAAWYAAAA